MQSRYLAAARFRLTCAGAVSVGESVHGESGLEPGGLYGVAVQGLMVRAGCGS